MRRNTLEPQTSLTVSVNSSHNLLTEEWNYKKVICRLDVSRKITGHTHDRQKGLQTTRKREGRTNIWYQLDPTGFLNTPVLGIKYYCIEEPLVLVTACFQQVDGHKAGKLPPPPPRKKPFDRCRDRIWFEILTERAGTHVFVRACTRG